MLQADPTDAAARKAVLRLRRRSTAAGLSLKASARSLLSAPPAARSYARGFFPDGPAALEDPETPRVDASPRAFSVVSSTAPAGVDEGLVPWDDVELMPLTDRASPTERARRRSDKGSPTELRAPGAATPSPPRAHSRVATPAWGPAPGASADDGTAPLADADPPEDPILAAGGLDLPNGDGEVVSEEVCGRLRAPGPCGSWSRSAAAWAKRPPPPPPRPHRGFRHQHKVCVPKLNIKLRPLQ